MTSSLHGLLVGVLLFGSALMPASREESNVKLFTAYDPSKVSDAISGGGEPNVQTPAASAAPANPQPKPAEQAPPPAPKPAPEPPQVHKAEPPQQPEKVEPPKVSHNVRNEIPDLKPDKTIEKTPRLSPEDMALVKPKATHKPRKPHPLDPKDLQQTTSSSEESVNAAHEAAVAAAKARQRAIAREFASAYKSISSHNSSSTPLVIGASPGAGGGGEASVNYRDLIASKYYNAWNPPAVLDEGTSIVTATVTIARDGNVISARITKPSGNPVMDRSITNVLEMVTFFEPFPEGVKESQRTFTIQFNLQAKRAIG